MRLTLRTSEKELVPYNGITKWDQTHFVSQAEARVQEHCVTSSTRFTSQRVKRPYTCTVTRVSHSTPLKNKLRSLNIFRSDKASHFYHAKDKQTRSKDLKGCDLAVTSIALHKEKDRQRSMAFRIISEDCLTWVHEQDSLSMNFFDLRGWCVNSQGGSSALEGDWGVWL